ncbi:hypothetical protein ACFFTN_05525 [Aminobacter aganoensis]|uniref:Uncharacterized protein n=1 Tax=Aminobacter aganoensis TaxID=83264 RepID=A0A7X0F511_9HYPH|nr:MULTISPECIES: hypothetical protein [Aminobacter]MBB6353201.1 hypothetical protein [Aminobacter aganoensis]
MSEFVSWTAGETSVAGLAIRGIEPPTPGVSAGQNECSAALARHSVARSKAQSPRPMS